MSTEKGVTRSDFGQLDKPKRTDAGFLRADAYLTRAGIFTYQQPDGTTRRELRSPEEVFHRDSIGSFELAPVTDNHPPKNINADNAREFARGAVSENLRQDGEMLRGSMLITDTKLIDKMERGDAGQVSCGYTCDVEFTAGEWNGQKYDAIQKNIRGNHVAIVPKGRAGDGVRVRMDARDAVMVFDPISSTVPTQEQTVALKTFRHDGVSFEAPEQVVELVEKLVKQRHDESAMSEEEKKKDAAKLAAMEAKADSALAEVAKLKADAADAPKRIRAEMAARMNLENGARSVLGKAVKLDGLSDREVRVAVLTKLEPKFDVAPKSDEYVSAKFDIAIESAKTDTTQELSETRTDEAPEVKHDAEAARLRSAKEMREMWKAPIGRQVNS